MFRRLLILIVSTGWVISCGDDEVPQEADGCPNPLPAVEEVVGQLEGLTLEAFIEESYFQVGCRKRFHINRFKDISETHQLTTYDLHIALLEMLLTFDRAALTPEEQISFDVYQWYLDDQKRKKAFMYHDYPVNHYIFSVLDDLDYYYTYYGIGDEVYAEYYIEALEHLETTFADLTALLKKSEQLGITAPRFSLVLTIEMLTELITPDPRTHLYYLHFEQQVNRIEELEEGTRAALLDDAAKAIGEVVIPGYTSLRTYIQYLVDSVALTDHGVGALPNGAQYYQFLLRRHTTTSLTAAEIHQLGLDEVARIQAEMRLIFDQLGENYTADKSLTELFLQLAQDSGYVLDQGICDHYEALINEAFQQSTSAFSTIPNTPLEVICGEEGDYYTHPWGNQPGRFYAKVDEQEALYSMPTLAYHEAVPGHHFQIALVYESDLPEFRKRMRHSVYSEGWGLYAEYLAFDLGWYEGDLPGDLGRLQGELLRAVRLVVDTGIHAKGWSFDQALQYMTDNTGYVTEVLDLEGEVARYFVHPAQATSYKIGMLKILELRQKAMDQLGAAFSLIDFHDVVLSSAAVPLDVLTRLVDRYIEARLAGEKIAPRLSGSPMGNPWRPAALSAPYIP